MSLPQIPPTAMLNNSFALLAEDFIVDPINLETLNCKTIRSQMDPNSVDFSNEEDLSPLGSPHSTSLKNPHNPVKDNPMLNTNMGAILDDVCSHRKEKRHVHLSIGPASNTRHTASQGERSGPNQNRGGKVVNHSK